MKYLTILALLFGPTCQAGTIIGRVVGVADGDTIKVLDADKVQHKIRLTGIDAPEKKQAFGNRSKESLSDIVLLGVRLQLILQPALPELFETAFGRFFVALVTARVAVNGYLHCHAVPWSVC